MTPKLNARNRRIPIDKIIIPEEFTKTHPNPKKLLDRCLKTVKVDKKGNAIVEKNLLHISVDENFVLFDGYISYLIYKALGTMGHKGFDKIKVTITREVKEND